MPSVYNKQELIDLFERVWQRAYPDHPISRKKLDEFIDDVRENELVKSDAGVKNMTGIEVLAGVAISVLSSVVYDMLKVGAKKLFEQKTDEQIVQQVCPTRNQERREVALKVIAEVRVHEVDAIDEQIRRKGMQPPKS